MEETTANVQKESMAGMEIGRPPFRYIQVGQDIEKNKINLQIVCNYNLPHSCYL